MTEYDNLNLNRIKISWSAPYSNSAVITGYLIVIQQKNGEYIASSECDGQSASVISNLSCYVNLETLREVPFSLSFDSLILVKAKAQNKFGWAEFSQPNNYGAKI